jgi:hypothetical protein
LYDQETDAGENRNVAGLPAYAETVKRLSAKLHASWRACLPA